MRRTPEIVDRRFDTADRYQFHPDLTLTEVDALADWCGGTRLTNSSNGRITRVVILLNGDYAQMGDWIVRDGDDFRIEAAA